MKSNISAGLIKSYAVFTHLSGDVYADNGGKNRTEKWAVNATSGVPVIYAIGGCHGLFIDIDDQIYCSCTDFHEVIKQSAMDAPNSWTTAAGNGTNGSGPYLLNKPIGIFVDTTLSVYIADSANHRVQLFFPSQQNGTTVAGKGAPSTITLNDPCAVVLDGDGYLFIVDRGNHRIVASGPAGFRCIAGCTGTNGSAANQLSRPQRIALDSSGNIFVVDGDNQRIQKFLLAPNSCGKLSIIPPIVPFVLKTSLKRQNGHSLNQLHFPSVFSIGVSYNRPKFGVCAKWNADAITFANSSVLDSDPTAAFVNYEQFYLCERNH